MKTITKSECLALIKRLESGKCRCLKYNVECFCETPDRPILFGDLLEQMEDINGVFDWSGRPYVPKKCYCGGCGEWGGVDAMEVLTELWSNFGFSMSLQEILKSSAECWNPELCVKDDVTFDLFLFLNEIL